MPMPWKLKMRLGPHNGFVFGHDNKPVVNEGKALFHVGY